MYVVCTPSIQWILVRTTTNILEMVCAVLHSLCTTTHHVVFLVHDQPFVRDAFPFFISSNCKSHSNIISTIGAPRRPMTNNDQPNSPCPLIITTSGNAHQPTRSLSRLVGRPFKIFSSSTWRALPATSTEPARQTGRLNQEPTFCIWHLSLLCLMQLCNSVKYNSFHTWEIMVML